MSGLSLLISDHHGIYVPQRFFENYNCEVWGIDPNSLDADAVVAGPEHKWYWEAWDWILTTASHKDENGNVWTLHQDGDLWAVCVDLMTDEEYEGYFGEPRPFPDSETLAEIDRALVANIG